MTSDLKPIAEIYRAYQALAAAFPSSDSGEQSSLGGKLFYAGEIDSQSGNMLYAANIAGAASLAASPDPAIQRKAIREGLIDFLVTSLEEALRILKNEIRKKETVSVGVSIPAARLIAEMLDRGVLPDLLPQPPLQLFAEYQQQLDRLVAQGSRLIAHFPIAGEGGQFVTWSIDRNFARWLPQLDQCARAVIPVADSMRQRWLRLAPRYLGRMAQREHGVVMFDGELDRFRREAESLNRQNTENNEEPIALEIHASAVERN